MRNQLQKAINIAKNTGDRVIIFDSIESESAHVVMSLDEYEKLVLGKNEVRGLTEDELLDKINRDIAIWKNDKKEEENENKREEDNANITEEFVENEPEEGMQEEEEVKNDKKSAWGIPKDIKEGAEEVIDEDRQYLEEVTF